MATTRRVILQELVTVDGSELIPRRHPATLVIHQWLTPLAGLGWVRT